MAKAKSKATKPNKLLQQWRSGTQTLTVGSAIAYGFLWVFDSIFSTSTPSWVDTLGKVLLLATIIGGVSMGLLFAAQPAKKK